MRFHSYGPVEAHLHYSVPRTELVADCVETLIGQGALPGQASGDGHYFTIWAPRQTGKTWLMRQAIAEIRRTRVDEFIVGKMSMQGISAGEGVPMEQFFERLTKLLRNAFDLVGLDTLRNWDDFQELFHARAGHFNRPVILLVDEFDNLPHEIIDPMIQRFRDIYLDRESHLLHGLALIGVRAVLGLASKRGSPFNVQRSVHVPNLTADEVAAMFEQYQTESGQTVEPAVVAEVYRVTRGQPGLVGWFGELLTEKYNPGKEQPIDHAVWQKTYLSARRLEPNNTLINLVAKARGEHRDRVMSLFANPDTPFDFQTNWCNYLYMNGVIAPEWSTKGSGEPELVCRFSSQFVQEAIYSALASDLVGTRTPILAIDPLDALEDVFTPTGLALPKLLARYKEYLVRLEAAGIDPWLEQPRRRTDLHLQESVGHFHLYAWLQNAIGSECRIAPEFPTGNGKIDLHIRWQHHAGLIEVKSFVSNVVLARGRQQAAEYARKMNLTAVTMAVFVPVKDESVLEQLSGELTIDGVVVNVVAIGWA